MRKPANSPMLLASAASQSASSPASGGRTNIAGERHTERRQNGNNMEQLSESVSHTQLLKAIASTSTIEMSSKDQTNAGAVMGNSSEKLAEDPTDSYGPVKIPNFKAR